MSELSAVTDSKANNPLARKLSKILDNQLENDKVSWHLIEYIIHLIFISK